MTFTVVFWTVVCAAIALVVAELVSSVRIARKARRVVRLSMADLLPYRRLVGARKDAMSLTNGGFLAMFEIDAADAGAFDDFALADTDAGIGRALGAISEKFVVHLRERHTSSREYTVPHTPYTNPVLAWIDGRRKLYFESGKVRRTRRVVSLAWKPETVANAKLTKLATRQTGDTSEIVARDDYSTFERDVERAMAFLRSYCSVRRLGVRVDEVFGVRVQRSEIFEELKRCISGREVPVSVPSTLIAGNSLLAEPMRGGGDVAIGESEISVVVLKDFPKETEPLALARLRQAGIDYDLVVRWIPMASADARKLLKGAHASWEMQSNEGTRMADPHAIAMMRDAEEASAYASDGVRFGMLSPFVVVRGPSRTIADREATKVLTILDELGMSAFIATTTAEDDFFATLPADLIHGSRAYQMHQTTLAHLFTLHEQSPGPRSLGIPSLPKDSPPLAYVTSGRRGEDAIHRLSLSTDPPDLLHFLGIGGSGSGKSVSIAMMVASWLGRVPYGGATNLDKGRSMYRFARFMDAPFYDLLGADGTVSPGFALFSNVEDPVFAGELGDILVSMCELNHVTMTPTRTTAIEEAIAAVRQLDSHLRSMTAFLEFLQDSEGVLKPVFALYTRGGRLGRTLDCEVDSFETSLWNVIELGALWGAHPRYLIPVLSVLFWKIRQSVVARRVATGNHLQHHLIQLDEAHAPMKHPLGEAFISRILKEGRRDKIAIGLWSNAAREFAKSGLLNDFIEQVKSRFYFRNTGVLDTSGEVGERVRDFYAMLDLPEHGIGWLPQVAPHSFLVHQPEIRGLSECDWKLDRETLAVLGKTSHAENAWLDGYIAKYPKTWKEEVLRAEGCSTAAIDEFLALVAAHNERVAEVAALTSLHHAQAAHTNGALVAQGDVHG